MTTRIINDEIKEVFKGCTLYFGCIANGNVHFSTPSIHTKAGLYVCGIDIPLDSYIFTNEYKNGNVITNFKVDDPIIQDLIQYEYVYEI